MIKDKQNLNTHTSTIDVLTKNYQLLISNKWISYRKKLADDLDKIFIPTVGYSGWKQRFLYPIKNIPKKDYSMISTIMGETLIRKIEEQLDYLHEQLKSKQKELDEIQNIITESENAIKNFNKK